MSPRTAEATGETQEEREGRRKGESEEERNETI